MQRRVRLALAIPLLFAASACSSDSSSDSASTAAPPVATDTADTAATPASSAGGVDTSTASSQANDSTTVDSGAEPSGDGSSFSVSISEPAAIDPALSREVEGAQVTRLLFQNLVSLSPELEVVPGVATEWSVSDDGLVWTFVLSPDATFSDGRPVVASDFVFSFARSADPDVASAAAYQGLPIKGWEAVNAAEPSGEIGDEPVEGVVAVDDHTLTVETEAPFALLPKVLTYPIFAPVAPEYVATEDDAAAFADAPVGNGIYMMQGSWEHNVGITVVKNPNYHGTPGIADEIDFRIYSEAATATRDFEAGAVDIARNVPAELVSEAKELGGDRFLVTQTGGLGYIGFPVNVAPFDNPDIRLALSLAVDREAIAERIWSGTQAPATGYVPQQVPGTLQTVCDGCTYDPERAKQLFEDAGGIPGNSLVLYDISDDGQEGLEPIINSWRDLFGIDIEVRSFEFAQFLEETATGKAIGPFELGWVWDYPSMYSFLSPLFESTSAANNLSYSNPDFDALLEQARTAADEESGLPFLTEAQALVEKDLPMIPLLFANATDVYAERLSNVFVDAGALVRLELVEVSG